MKKNSYQTNGVCLYLCQWIEEKKCTEKVSKTTIKTLFRFDTKNGMRKNEKEENKSFHNTDLFAFINDPSL